MTHRALDESDLEALQQCIDADTSTRTETFGFSHVKFDYSGIDVTAAREELTKLKVELSHRIQRKRERAAERLDLKRIESIEHDMIDRKDAAAIICKYGCPIFQKTHIKICKWSNTEHTRYCATISSRLKLTESIASKTS